MWLVDGALHETNVVAEEVHVEGKANSTCVVLTNAKETLVSLFTTLAHS